jgi:ubiquinone/menaquinone biosynthesis C-methylase UbiE/pimeloyl-ACP methyl ester carboxylesterase
LLSRGDRVAPDDIRRLHPSGIEGEAGVRALLERLRHEAIPLRRGMNRRIEPEVGWIERLEGDHFLLRTRNLEPARRSQLFLNFALDERSYFFAAPVIRQLEHDVLLGLPSAVYRAERRDRVRKAPRNGDPRHVSLTTESGHVLTGELVDVSPEGMAVQLPECDVSLSHGVVRLCFADGERQGRRLYGEVRHVSPGPGGGTRVGLATSAMSRGAALQVDERTEVNEATSLDRVRRLWALASGGARMFSRRAVEAVSARARRLPPVRVVDFENDKGEFIRGILDSTGDTRGATAVVIPPAWGRTKETLMPLAACLVAGFQRAGQPLVVLRFDGVRRRGESYRDPDCEPSGSDHYRFTFSQGVRDIRAAVDFLEGSPEFAPENIVLVSFSAASIEARRAMASDPRLSGWVSVVGASDLQSMMRVISGGVDYARGLERGLRFGLQEILGIEVDMDRAGLDAFEHELVYLEDARRDMARIQVPVTWIHGRHDAWMDGERAVDVLSRGDTTLRRFVTVPTGHMLKTSREALDTFQLVADEVGEMAVGRKIPNAMPDVAELERKQRAERGRLHDDPGDVKSFWHDYLLGQDDGPSFELMTGVTPYAELMEAQVDALALRDGDHVADLGAGTGAFAVHLAENGGPRVQVFAVDYVRDALRRGRKRLQATHPPRDLRVVPVEADLDVGRGGVAIPLATGSMDAVLASLLLSYVSSTQALLAEAQRVLRPGGRLVVSSLRRDADMSRLYTEGVDELRAGRARELFGEEGEAHLDEAARRYLNRAARLLDLEERGTFRFFDPPELEKLLRGAGFTTQATIRSLGDPPQAVVLVAERT